MNRIQQAEEWWDFLLLSVNVITDYVTHTRNHGAPDGFLAEPTVLGAKLQ